MKLGRLVFSQTMQLDDSCSAAYVLMSNVYVDGIGSVDLDEIVQAIEYVDS